MKSGFTFLGIHSSTYHVTRVPDAEAMFQKGADVQVYEDDIEWRDGGVYYISKVSPRVFSISCLYEELTDKQLSAMRQWLAVGNRGRLVFDDEPYKYYDVVITDRPSGKRYIANGVSSGIFTMTATAYLPFARMTKRYYENYDADGATNACLMLEKSDMPDEPTVTSSSFLVYDCGTIRTPCILRIGGVCGSGGLKIYNETTGQSCSLRALPPSPAYLEINSLTGCVRVIHEESGMNEIAFEYHDDGYIDLAPCGMLYGEMLVSSMAGSNILTIEDRDADESMIGKYIRAGGQWLKITAANENLITVNATVGSSATETVTPVTMNKISISGERTLSRLEIDYEPWIE